MVFGFAARGEPLIAAIKPLLGGPGVRDGARGCPILPASQGVSDKRMVAIVPRGFDQDPAEVRVAGLGNPTAGCVGATGMLRRDQADERHETGRGRNASRVAEFG